MGYTAVIFDLDGTLLDTLEDIADTANRVLAGLGFPTHAAASYRDLIGEGLSSLYQRALPRDAIDRDLIGRCAVQHRAIYQENWNSKTRPYDGIMNLLAELAELGIKMAVLSNKPDHFTQLCVNEFFPPGSFEVVLGMREHVEPKPDSVGALEIADRLKTPPRNFVFLGDTKVDMQTAGNANMLAVGALWGFRSRDELQRHGAKLLIEHPHELIDVFRSDAAYPV